MLWENFLVNRADKYKFCTKFVLVVFKTQNCGSVASHWVMRYAIQECAKGAESNSDRAGAHIQFSRSCPTHTRARRVSKIKSWRCSCTFFPGAAHGHVGLEKLSKLKHERRKFLKKQSGPSDIPEHGHHLTQFRSHRANLTKSSTTCFKFML